MTALTESSAPGETVPGLDANAARRWMAAAPAEAPWLHGEVGRRMQERLEWIRLKPQAWANWEAVRGDLEVHRLIAQRYSDASVWLVESAAHRATHARQALSAPWWSARRWTGAAPRVGRPDDGAVQMVWANMLLHLSAEPQALIRQWHRALSPGGFLMFSTFGPDTLDALQHLYAELGFGVPAQAFTDMHDWGDMLVEAGFAEPVMDMEHITLTFADPQRLLAELRGLGRNLSSRRHPALRGRAWHRRLLQALNDGLRSATAPAGDGSSPDAGERPRLALRFEIIYGHALRAPEMTRVKPTTEVPLDDMRRLLRERKRGSAQN